MTLGQFYVKNHKWDFAAFYTFWAVFDENIFTISLGLITLVRRRFYETVEINRIAEITLLFSKPSSFYTIHPNLCLFLFSVKFQR